MLDPDGLNVWFESLYGNYAALQRIEQIVTKQCQRTLYP